MTNVQHKFSAAPAYPVEIKPDSLESVKAPGEPRKVIVSHFEPFAASQPRSIMALANGDHVLFEQISKDQWTTTRLPADLLELLFRHMQTTGMVSPWVPYLPGASTFETTVQHKPDGTSKKKLTRPGLFTHAGLVLPSTLNIFLMLRVPSQLVMTGFPSFLPPPNRRRLLGSMRPCLSNLDELDSSLMAFAFFIASSTIRRSTLLK